VFVSKRIIVSGNDGDGSGGDDLDPDACTGACAADNLLGDNNNDDDDDAAELNAEVAIDEIISITIAKVSVITMNNVFIFYSMQFRTNLLRPFVIFYLIQTIFHFRLLKHL
jgi:hypothetical protein